MKKRNKIILSCIIAFFVIAFSFAGYRLHNMNKLQSFKETYAQLNSTIPNYNLIGSQKYVCDGKPCMGYYVVISPKATNEELYKVFYHVCNDKYYLHTVWFSSTSKKAGKAAYDVAMLEETDRSKWATINRA